MRRLILATGGLLVVVTLAARLITAQGGGAATLTLFEGDWNITRYPSNPVVSTANNPAEDNEQYVPCPILLPNGDVWVYVKGLGVIYGWKSVDGGETFTLENGGDPVIDVTPAAWDAEFATEPCVVYDEPTDTIHMFYKGTNDPDQDGSWGWGHATADGSDPTTFTKDAGNPILTTATAETDLGGGTIEDLAISDVVMNGSTYHFYGYALYNNRYQLIHATGTDWDNPSGVESLLLAESDSHVANVPFVFTVPGHLGYHMWYSYGSTGSGGSRHMRAATSLDMETWDFSDTTAVMSPTSGWESLRAHAAHILRETEAPYLAPIVEDGTWRLYYSGQSGLIADSGLAYMDPN
jgi:hypothetical protein